MSNIFIHSNIKLLRKGYNISQQELGRMLGVSKAVILKYEQGQEPPISIIVQLCHRFRLDVTAFCTVDLTQTGIQGAQGVNGKVSLQALEQQMQHYFKSNEQERAAMYRQLCFDHQALVRLLVPGVKPA